MMFTGSLLIMVLTLLVVYLIAQCKSKSKCFSPQFKPENIRRDSTAASEQITRSDSVLYVHNSVVNTEAVHLSRFIGTPNLNFSFLLSF